MRRSSAPSWKRGQSVHTPLQAISSVCDNTDLLNAAPVANAARNTATILNLLTSNEEPESDAIQIHTAKEAAPQNDIRVFNVVWGKQSTKKHKTWEGDGTLELREKSVVLKDVDGTIIGRASGIKTSILAEGSQLFVASKQVEIIDVASVTATSYEENTMQPISKRLKTSQAES